MTLRSAAVWQTDLALVAWAVVCSALATFIMEADPPGFRALPFGLTPLVGVGVISLLGFAIGFALRRFLTRWDFRFVTDESTYFFADNGTEASYCPRNSIRAVRHEAGGISLDMIGGQVLRITEKHPVILLAVHNLLERWAQEGEDWGDRRGTPKA